MIEGERERGKERKRYLKPIIIAIKILSKRNIKRFEISMFYTVEKTLTQFKVEGWYHPPSVFSPTVLIFSDSHECSNNVSSPFCYFEKMVAASELIDLWDFLQYRAAFKCQLCPPFVLPWWAFPDQLIAPTW